jgi:hypothetical protein
MRQIFTVRFFAAVGGVIGLFFLLTTIFATREVIEGGEGDANGVEIHEIDFVDQVFSSRNERFAVDEEEGVALNDTELILDPSRSLFVVQDTPGVDHCPRFPQVGACAVVADLLGEGVVWFALVPSGTDRTVDLPAIDTLDDGLATLVNGWRLPYAPILDRRCDEEFSSYVEFRDTLGDDFTSIYDLDERRIVAAECRTRVAYAPEPRLDESDPDAPLPAPPFDPADPAELEETLTGALVGQDLDAAVERLEAAGWTVRVDDLAESGEVTADLEVDRVAVGHRDEIVVGVVLG